MSAATETRAVVFDLDGTLLDTLEDIRTHLARAMLAHGFREPTRAEVKSWVGDGARALVAKALELDADRNAPLVSEVLARYQEEAESDPTPATAAMPGAIELLDALGERGIVSVICTNKIGVVARPIVARMFGARVRGVIGGGDVDELKPHRMPIDASLAIVGVAPAAAWMVGDGPQDVLAAHAAGVRAIALKGDAKWDRVLAARPDVVVEHLHEVLAVVLPSLSAPR
jgi:phosphoglycolate phosphatase